MSKKKEEWNPFDTMSEERMKSIKSDVDFREVISKCLKKKKPHKSQFCKELSIKFKRFCIFASEFRNLDVLYTR